MDSDSEVPTLVCERCGSFQEVQQLVSFVADGDDGELAEHALCRACLVERVRAECEAQVEFGLRKMREIPPGAERHWERWAQVVSDRIRESADEWGFSLSDRASAFVERHRGG